MYRIMTPVVLTVAGCVSLLQLGCGPRHDWAGQWRGNYNLQVQPGEDPNIARMVGEVRLTLKADSTFELTEGGMPKRGSFRVSGDKAYLKIREYMGQPIDRLGVSAKQMNEEIRVTWRGDNSVDFFDPAGFFDVPIILKRHEQPK